MSEDMSIMDLNMVLKDMATRKSSLKREIDQNELTAISLREELKALEDKRGIISNKVKEADLMLIKRREEISNIDALLDKERVKLENENKDFAQKIQAFRNEQMVWESEKKAALDSINEIRAKIAREDVSSMNLKFDLENKHKDVDGQIEELGRRRIKISNDEVKISNLRVEADKLLDEAKKKLYEAAKVEDEAKAKIVAYDELLSKVTQAEKEIKEKEQHLKVVAQENDAKENELKDREREVILEEGKLKELSKKLLREVQIAKVSKEVKDEIIKEIQ